MKSGNKKRIVILLVSVLIIGGFGGFFIIKDSSINKGPSTESSATVDTNKLNPAVGDQSTEAQLLYLIEEEKLAHDVYSIMFQQYGANVFGNIQNSESTHQAKVLTLLQSRNIPDPRSPELRIFNNQDLQSLYNQLVEKGSKSNLEAYKVGVIIEEKDIADISTQLATTTDQDIITTLEILRSGSENHLRAFNKQL